MANGWGWFYLSTILDDYSRHIVAWRLCTTMRATDVTHTLEDALVASGCDHATVAHRPRLLSDNGSSHVSGDLADWLRDQGIGHIRGAPNHPQTQGKIERWHQTLKNRVLLENDYLPGALEQAVGAFVENCNHRRYHEILGTLTPADAYSGRAASILSKRSEIKQKTIRQRRLLHQQSVAQPGSTMGQILRSRSGAPVPNHLTTDTRSLLGRAVQIYCAEHHKDPVQRAEGQEIAHPVQIGSDVWIGGAAILLPGVTIGDGAIVGAGSVVTRSVSTGDTVVGNPARLLASAQTSPSTRR
jgi:acetyltransferase-like isoleucine patch superfamily enzyme